MFNINRPNVYTKKGNRLNSTVQGENINPRYFRQIKNSQENKAIFDNFTVAFNFFLPTYSGISNTNSVQWLFLFRQKHTSTARFFGRLLTASNLNITYTTPEAVNNSFNIGYTLNEPQSFGLSFEKNVRIKAYCGANEVNRVTRPYLASDLASDFNFLNNTQTGFKNDRLQIWNFRLFHKVLTKEELHAVNAYNDKILGSGFSADIQNALLFEYLLNNENGRHIIDTGPNGDHAELFGYDQKDTLANGMAWITP